MGGLEVIAGERFVDAPCLHEVGLCVVEVVGGIFWRGSEFESRDAIRRGLKTQR